MSRLVIEYKDYQLRPYSNHLCWELYKYREVKSSKTGETRKDWVSMDKYPSSLGHGLQIIYELELKEGNEVKDLKSAITTAKRLQRELMELGEDDGR